MQTAIETSKKVEAKRVALDKTYIKIVKIIENLTKKTIAKN